MSDLFVDNIKHQSSQGSGTITIGASGESITVPNGSLTGQNYPAFEATMSADQNTTNSVFTKIQYNTESFDTDSCYDATTNYRFTPTVAGKYFFYATARMTANANSELGSHIIGLSKNGTVIQRVASNPAANYGNSSNLTFNMINSANGSTDYYEIFIYILDVSGTPSVLGGVYSNFGAYRIGA